MAIALQRAYDKPRRTGYRVLVDRVWPRGRSKRQLELDAWLKDVAPSTALRKWFAHDVRRWPEFKRRYRRELATAEQRVRLRELATIAKRKKLTLVYGAKDELHNQAVVLREALSRLI